MHQKKENVKTEMMEYTFEHISGADGFSLLQVTAGRKLNDTCHTHDFYEIVMVAQGSIVQEINGVTHQNYPGDYVILYPEASHRIVSQKKGTSVICLSVKASEFMKFAELFCHNKICEFSPGHMPEIYGIGADFSACVAAAEKGMSEGGDVFRKRLLAIILSDFSNGKSITSKVHNGNLYNAAEMMKSGNNLCEGIPAFLRLSGYSHTHLARLVKKEYGCTLHEYIFRLRLEEAHRRIVYTGEKIESISLNVGYDSFSHFNRIFKQHFGITPSALRKKHGFSTV